MGHFVQQHLVNFVQASRRSEVARKRNTPMVMVALAKACFGPIPAKTPLRRKSVDFEQLSSSLFHPL
jgi:hypothetical protein